MMEAKNNNGSISCILDSVISQLNVNIRFCNSFDEADAEIKCVNLFITNEIEGRNFNHPLIRIYSIPEKDRFIIVIKHSTNDHRFDEDFHSEVDIICTLLAKLTNEKCRNSLNKSIANIFATATDDTFIDEIKTEWKSRILASVAIDSGTITECTADDEDIICVDDSQCEETEECCLDEDKMQDCEAMVDEYELKASALADNKDKFNQFVLVSKLYKGLIELENKFHNQLGNMQNALYNLRNEFSNDFIELHRLLSDYGNGEEENFNYEEYAKCPYAYEVYMQCGRLGIPIETGNIFDLSNGDYGMGSKSIIVNVNYVPIKNGYESAATPLTLHYDYSGCIIWEHPERVPYPFEGYQREEDYALKMKLHII